jgi:hypothetical protein
MLYIYYEYKKKVTDNPAYIFCLMDISIILFFQLNFFSLVE